MFADFHFLRPEWFVALLPALLLVWLLAKRASASRGWQQLIAPELLVHLLDQSAPPQRRWARLALAAGLIIAVIALAGPTWEKRPSAVQKNSAALVIALDLSPSMQSQDLKPSRVTRARLKIIDILNTRRDGQTALIAYAGDAHVVSPLTQDANNIQLQLAALSPEIMPLAGSNTEAALTRAASLIRDAGLTRGEVLLITDGVDPAALEALAQMRASFSHLRIHVLGVGTASPTPIPSSRGGFVRDAQGALVTTQLDATSLAGLARDFNGRYHSFTDTDTDIRHLLASDTTNLHGEGESARQFDLWYDQGRWLVLALLPGVLYAFRRGLLGLMLMIPLALAGWMTPAAPVIASEQTDTAPSVDTAGYHSWFLNRDQRGAQALAADDPSAAAALFEDPQWQAAARYRAGDYAGAAELYQQDTSARGAYNLGNALAQQGQIDAAIAAYDKALVLEPAHRDAKANKALLEQLKKQQDEQQQNQQDQNQDQDSQDQNQESQDQKQTSDNQDAQNQNSQNQDQQSQQNQNSSAGESQNDPSSADTSADNSAQQNPSGQNSSAQSSSEQNSPAQGDEPERASEQDSQPPSQNERPDAANAASSDAGAEADAANSAAAAQSSAAATSEAEATQAMLQPGELDPDGLNQEERQALEQWLRQVPDDPGMLLRNKFQDQYRARRQQMYNGDWSAPDNGAAERL